MDTDRDRHQWAPTPELPDAACRGYPVEWWVPPRGALPSPARAICEQCPERDPCLAWALATPQVEGMWGGTGQRDRMAIRKQRKETLMTMTTSNPERAQRVADLWTRRPTMTEAEVSEQVDADLAAEAEERAEERAEGEAWAKGISDSITRMMFTCPVCGESRMPREGQCDKCRPVVAQVTAERRMAEMVRGRTRRELAGAYLDKKGV